MVDRVSPTAGNRYDVFKDIRIGLNKKFMILAFLPQHFSTTMDRMHSKKSQKEGGPRQGHRLEVRSKSGRAPTIQSDVDRNQAESPFNPYASPGKSFSSSHSPFLSNSRMMSPSWNQPSSTARVGHAPVYPMDHSDFQSEPAESVNVSRGDVADAFRAQVLAACTASAFPEQPGLYRAMFPEPSFAGVGETANRSLDFSHLLAPAEPFPEMPQIPVDDYFGGGGSSHVNSEIAESFRIQVFAACSRAASEASRLSPKRSSIESTPGPFSPVPPQLTQTPQREIPVTPARSHQPPVSPRVVILRTPQTLSVEVPVGSVKTIETPARIEIVSAVSPKVQNTPRTENVAEISKGATPRMPEVIPKPFDLNSPRTLKSVRVVQREALDLSSPGTRVAPVDVPQPSSPRSLKSVRVVQQESLDLSSPGPRVAPVDVPQPSSPRSLKSVQVVYAVDTTPASVAPVSPSSTVVQSPTKPPNPSIAQAVVEGAVESALKAEQGSSESSSSSSRSSSSAVEQLENAQMDVSSPVYGGLLEEGEVVAEVEPVDMMDEEQPGVKEEAVAEIAVEHFEESAEQEEPPAAPRGCFARFCLPF